MSSFEHYRRTQVDMLHLVSHLMQVQREPGHLDSSSVQRDVYDHLHHRFLDTLQVSYARLESIGKAPPGLASGDFGVQRAAVKRRRQMPAERTRWGKPRSKRTRANMPVTASNALPMWDEFDPFTAYAPPSGAPQSSRIH